MSLPRPDPSLIHLLRRRADAAPAQPYLRFLLTGEIDGPQAERTVGEVDVAARRIGAWLRARGAAGERALMLYPPGEHFVEAFFGCLFAGVVAVPAYPPDPGRLERTLPRLRAVAEDASARFVLAPAAICQMAAALSAVEPRLASLTWIATDDVPTGAEDGWEMPDVDEASIAFLQYTSGSTGTPRGVRVTHGNLLHNLEIIRRCFGNRPGELGVIWLPAYHDMGLIGGVLQPLYAGVPACFLSPLDFLRRPVRWLQAISRTGASISGGPDFAYRLCVRKATDDDVARLDLRSWRVAFSGAEPVRAETLAEFAARFAPAGFDRRAFYPTYGLAECTLLVSGHQGAPREPEIALLDRDALARGAVAEPAAGAPAARLVSCGPLAPDLEACIVDLGTGRPSPPEAVGELWVRGGSVASGYHGDPDATRETFEARLPGDERAWLRTGDLGFFRSGELFIAGRHKDLLILRGRNVYPQDLEHTAAEAHPRVRPGCVAAFSVDVDGIEHAALAAEIDERGEALDVAGLARALRAAVADAHDVELFSVALLPRNAMPKTSSGKVRRFACQAAFLDGSLEELGRDTLPAAPSVAVSVEAPRDHAAAVAALQRLAAAQLGVAPAAVDTALPFQSLGLDSLRLVELTSQVESLFRRPIETMTLFSHPTIDTLAAHLLRAPFANGAAAPPHVAVAAGSPYVGLAEACAPLERRSTRYQFDLEADVSWAELDAPGDYVSEALLRDLGFDVEGLRAHPAAWDLLQWAMALQVCATFELLEIGVVLFARQEAAPLGRTRSVELLADEEDKHIQLFRRYARHLKAQRPALAARLAALSRDTHDAILTGHGLHAGRAREDDPRAYHYASWLRILFFEEYTVHFHQCLKEGAAGRIQPAWLSAHAAHRREEVQHIATDVRYLACLDLDAADRYRLSAGFALQMVEDFDRQFAVEGARRLVSDVYPGVPVLTSAPHRAERCITDLVSRRVFSHSWQAAPFFRELPALPASEVLSAARAAAAPSKVELGAAEVPAPGARTAEPVAIVGMGCRLPGSVSGPDALWSLVLEGRDAITEVPPDRWDVDAWFDPDPSAPGRMYTRWGGFVDHIQDFDPAFFGITPKEARHMDPQQRLLLEVTWEALEHAGVPPSRLAGTRGAVFVGICSHDYSHRDVIDPINAYTGTGTAFSIAAGRISYLLGMHGPCVAVDTACSSSLVAVHQACRALEDGEADLALVGGVNAILVPESTVFFSALRAMSPTGRCRTFDAGADGYVRSEGCGVVVLKRLRDARRDGDRIFAVVSGSAVNQDGRSNGITAPNGRAQEAVMRAALARAGLVPADVAYVEAHGTGTPLGDPIEAQAIGAVHRGRAAAAGPVLVGSVKTHLGHSEGAAGVAGLIQAALVVERGIVPPNLHFERPNPHVPWHELPLEIVTTARALSGRRVASVNSFGFGGTNAHVVLTAPPPRPLRSHATARPLHPVVVSGHTREALAAQAARLAAGLPDAPLHDVSHTLCAGRDHFPHRAAFMAESAEQARGVLEAIARGEQPPGVAQSDEGGAGEREPIVAFLFTGQGAQYAGMARELYDTQPVFRATVDELATFFDPLLALPLRSVLFDADAPISQTAFTQPALFAVELGLANLWRSFGVTPRVVIGHSIGEIAAACFAGMLSLGDAAALVAARGRLMQALPRDGAMFSVAADEATVRAALAPYGDALSVASANAPRQMVISGDAGAAREVAAALSARGVETRALDVSHAFHSAKMRPMLAELRAVAAGIAYQAPALRIVSNLDAALPPEAMGSPDYWTEHVMGCVRFADGLGRVMELGATALVEIGPHPILLGLAGLCGAGDAILLPSLRRGRPDWSVLGDSVCRLYAAGAALDWAGFDAPYAPERVTLPTYAFQRQRCWLEEAPALAGGGAQADHPLLGIQLDVAGRASWEGRVSAARPAWLADHRVAGRSVMPATAWLELLHAAAARAPGVGAAFELVDVEIARALVVDEAATRRVQIAVSDDAVEAYSRDDGRDARWTRHVRARVARCEAAPSTTVAPPMEEAGEPVDVAAGYAELAAVGLAYGPCFRGLHALRVAGDVAIAEIALPDALPAEDGYALHPALLDAALQAAGALTGYDGGDPHTPGPAGGELCLPVGVARYRCFVPGATRAHVIVLRKEPLVFDLRLADATGRTLAELDGLRFRAVDASVFERAGAAAAGEDAALEVRWEVVPLPEGHGDLGGAWRVVGTGPIAEAVACTLGAPRGVDLDGALERADLRGVVLIAGTGAHPAELRAVVEPALLVAQALAARRGLSLTVATRGAWAAGEPGLAADPAQAALWGLCRTVAQEAPGLGCRLVDLDPQASDEASADALLRELRRLDGESQIAWRRGERRVARLAPVRSQRLEPPDAPSWHLAQRERGVLDSLFLAPAERRAPGPGEIEIAVESSGLNFRDVLNALGMYPGPAGPLGGECAGRVTAAGASVTALRVGDRVLALAGNAFGRYVITDARLAARCPRGLDAASAATLPVAFLTAWYGLYELGGLRAGQRVLIHAAAGGVGMAAVQLARRVGAEVVATASPGKWAGLRRLGVEHVLSSRRPEGLADAVRAATGGEGVDVVLNALTGEFIRQSFAALRPGGRFIEMGKAELLSAEQAAALRADVGYTPFDLLDVAPERLEGMLAELCAAFDADELSPLPHRAFALGAAPAAFRYMAQARHVGKVVLGAGAEETRLDAEATYLVTGGLGGLGRHVAGWLLARGARHVVLTARAEPDEERRAFVEGLRAGGAHVEIAVADLACEAEVRALLARIAAELPPLRGVIHAAGVLDDATLAQQSWPRFEALLGPKLAAAAWLDELTRGLPLDFFVLFSSVTATLGAAGQANYAAANAGLDALAERRRAEGLPAVSIGWGPWAGAGMAARLGARERARLAGQGLGAITPEQGLRWLERAIAGEQAHLVVAPLDRARLTAALGGRVPPFLSALLTEAKAAGEGPGLAEALAEVAPRDRHARLVQLLRERTARVMGAASPEAVHPRTPLRDLGLDSLMAVDLQNALSRAVGRALPETLLFDHPTLDAVAGYLLAEVLAMAPAAQASPEPEPPPAPTAAGEDAARAALAFELSQLEGLL